MVSIKIKMQLAMHVFTIDMAMVFTVRNIQLHACICAKRLIFMLSVLTKQRNFAQNVLQ